MSNTKLSPNKKKYQQPFVGKVVLCGSLVFMYEIVEISEDVVNIIKLGAFLKKICESILQNSNHGVAHKSYI